MNAMGTVNRNYLIKLDNAKQADEVFDVLHSLGEPIRTTTFIYNPDWCYVGFFNLSNNWTIARECSDFGRNIISFENFMKTFSSKDTVKKSDVEDYTGKTIKALVNSPQSTGVQIGEEIKILKLTDGKSRYELDKNAKGFSCMLINRPLNLTEWELVEESITKVDMKAIQEECKKRFPIGCTYQDPGDKIARVLRQDYSTYNIKGDEHIYANKYIYAHGGGGCLYKNGVYATLVSLPEEKPSIPEYVECINRNHFASDYTHIKVGKVFKWDDLTNGKEGTLNKNYNLWTEQFKPSTKEAYDAQFTTLHDVCSKGVENLIEKEIDYIYQVGYDDYYKTKPLIEDVHSVSVKLSTKKKTNKLIF